MRKTLIASVTVVGATVLSIVSALAGQCVDGKKFTYSTQYELYSACNGHGGLAYYCPTNSPCVNVAPVANKKAATNGCGGKKLDGSKATKSCSK